MRWRIIGLGPMEIYDEANGEWRAATTIDVIEVSGQLQGAQSDTLQRLRALMTSLNPGIDEVRLGIWAVGLLPGDLRDFDEDRARRVGKKKALSELRKIHDSVLALCTQLHDLGSEANYALNREIGGREGVDRTGDALDLLLRGAASAFLKMEKEPDSPARKKPRRDAPRYVASKARTIFEELTGHRGTRIVKDGKAGGPFLEFLTKVFEILEIDASPESASRGVWKKGRRADD